MARSCRTHRLHGMIGGSVELGAADVKRSKSGSSFLGVAAGGECHKAATGICSFLSSRPDTFTQAF